MNLKDLRPRRRIAATAIAVGLAVGAVGIGNAATSGSTAAADTAATTTQQTAATQSGAPTTAPPRGMDPSALTNGPGETLLTGTTAAKVTAAAKAAVPGGTIDRVETDAQGAAYEAHVTKADGTHVIVTFDENFDVVSTDAGPGGPGGPPPAQQAPVTP